MGEWSDLYEKFCNWKSQFLEGKCSSCPDNCCSTKKHTIRIEESSFDLFRKKGVPILDRSKFSLRILGKLKNNPPIPNPSIVYISDKESYYIYADRCPFLNSENLCDCHEDSRRPLVCKEYPIAFFINKHWEPCIGINNSCFAINEEVIKDLERSFPEVKLIY